jgi:pimeloyl-ACP methyl ester carboxylesterase
MNPAQVNGTQIAYEQNGTGPPLLLIHGFPLDRRMWAAQRAGLAEVARVIAPDLRGFGDSPVVEGTATMDILADDLLALLDHLHIDEPVAVCGLSMGGYVAFRLYEKAPSRVGKLILCDTRSDPDTSEAAAQRRETAQRVLGEGPDFLVEAMTPRLVAASTPEKQPAVVEALAQMIRQSDPRAVAAALLGMAERPDSTPLLSQIACPALIVVGQEDQITGPDVMRGLADSIPGAEMVTVADAGHMAPMEQPEAVNDAMRRFLDDR